MEALARLEELYATTCEDMGVARAPVVDAELARLRAADAPGGELSLRASTAPGAEPPLGPRDAQALFEALGALVNDVDLSALDLSYNAIGDAGAKALAFFLQRSRTVRAVRLAGNGVGHAGMAALAAAVDAHPTLEALDVSFNRAGDDAMVAVARAAARAGALRELAVAGTEQGTQAMVEFALALGASASLRRLDLSSPVLFSIEGEVYEHLARALLANRSLEHLVLARAGVRDHGAMWIADAVARSDRLVSLDLSGNRIAARGLACLADALCAVTRLERLNLSGNRVTDAAADDLHRAIRKNASVTDLGLADTGLGEEGLTAVGEALRHNRTLRLLSLRGNSFDGVSRDVFRELLAPLVGGARCAEPPTALLMEADRVDFLPLIA